CLPGLVESPDMVGRGFLERLDTAGTAESHEAIAVDLLHGLAHRTELAVSHHCTGLEGIMLALPLDDCLVELLKELLWILVELLNAHLAAEAHEAVLVDAVHGLSHRAEFFITHDNASRKRVVRQLLLDHLLVDLGEVLILVCFELADTAGAAEANFSAV